MFLVGLCGFAGASALGGVSRSFGMLVVARGLQGAAGAMLAPAALSVLTTTFADPAERGEGVRDVLNRNRGGSYLAISSARAMFGIFLFLTYFLRLNLRYSRVKTGLAFLPMIVVLMFSSTISTAVLLPRLGPRPLIPVGMLFAAGGMALLTRLGLHTSYLTGVLPGLLLVGFGLGLVFGCATNMATYGAAPEDAGVASATVNTSQQVGGSVGIALLNTIVASGTAGYLAAHGHSGLAVAQSDVHGINVGYTVCVGIFIAGAVVTAVVLAPGAPAPIADEAAPAIA
jgi:MFS family permease